jgi:hypothetical protein
MLLFLPPVLADEVVLAVHAPQVAVAEEDVPDSPGPHESGLLTEVGRCRRHNGQGAGIAPGAFIGQAVIAAEVRTDVAGAQALAQSVDTTVQLAALKEPAV